jgi:hypothetical protein
VDSLVLPGADEPSLHQPLRVNHEDEVLVRTAFLDRLEDTETKNISSYLCMVVRSCIEWDIGFKSKIIPTMVSGADLMELIWYPINWRNRHFLA